MQNTRISPAEIHIIGGNARYYMYAAEISAENIHIIEQKLTNYM